MGLSVADSLTNNKAKESEDKNWCDNAFDSRFDNELLSACHSARGVSFMRLSESNPADMMNE